MSDINTVYRSNNKDYEKTLVDYLYYFEINKIKYKHFQDIKICTKCNQLFLYDYFVYGDSCEKTLKLILHKHKKDNCSGKLLN